MSTNKRAFNTVEQGTHYEVPIYEVIDGKGIYETGAVMSIQFVRGSKLKDEDVPKREGTLHEHIISVMIEDLKHKRDLVPSKETSCAITHLQEAQHWLEERVIAREAAGVLGTYKPHKSE
jgi:hypothetical protein